MIPFTEVFNITLFRHGWEQGGEYLQRGSCPALLKLGSGPFRIPMTISVGPAIDQLFTLENLTLVL